MHYFSAAAHATTTRGTHPLWHSSVHSLGRQTNSGETWIFGSVWEVLSLCLSIWIAVKHFRELRQSSAGWNVEDYFTVLLKTHVLYFAG